MRIKMSQFSKAKMMPPNDKGKRCGFFALAFFIAAAFVASIVLFCAQNWVCCPYFVIAYVATWVAAALAECMPERSSLAIPARVVMTALMFAALILMLPTTEACDRDWMFFMSVASVFTIAALQIFIIAVRAYERCLPQPPDAGAIAAV
jgi:hypothetical protein